MKAPCSLIVSSLAALSTPSLFGALIAPPAGFSWLLESTSVYTDADNFNNPITLTQQLAPVTAPAASASIADTLVVTTFDPAAIEASFEALFPGEDYTVSVVSSTYNVTLDGLATGILINFDGVNHTYTGSLTLDSWEILLAGAAGPTTAALVNTAGQTVSPFGFVSFQDSASGLTAVTLSLSDNGLAAADGSTLTFNVSGLATLAITPDSVGAGTQFASANVIVTGNVAVQTTYEVYRLIPEPSSAVLVALSGGLLLVRRRR